MYRIRLQYAKSKEASYISHLDLMKVIERSLKRADINVKHSEGFNPRPEIVFAHPLSVGIESIAEICDIFLEEHYDEALFVKLLNTTLPSGITVLSAAYVDYKEKSLIAVVESAEYEITFEIPEDVISCSMPKEIEKLNKEIGDTLWSLFYSNIKGFKYEPCYEYVMELEKKNIKNPPTMGSSKRYKLIKTI